MKEGYRLLGDFIRQVDVRNTDGKEENLFGVSVQKMFIPSIANTIGTDFTKYKVVKRGQFTYIPDTSRRGDKIGIALLMDYDEGLVSNIYTVFEVKDENELLPEYLMLWFSRPEFDRYARFKSHGSVREIMDWDEMCKVELPVPSIDKQRSIVKAYQTITERIELKRRINDNLEATVQAVFKSLLIDYEGAEYPDFVEFEFGKYPSSWNLVDLDSVVDVRDGTHDSPSPTESGKYLITSRHLLPYAVDRSEAYFISEADFKKANERSKVEYGDILFSMIGTIGIITLITDEEIDFAIKNVGLFRTSQNPTMLLWPSNVKIVNNRLPN